MSQRPRGQRRTVEIPLPRHLYPDLHLSLEEAEDAFKNCSDIWWLHPSEFDEMRRLLNECKLLIESKRVGKLLPVPQTEEEAERLKTQRETMVYDRIALVWQLLEFLPAAAQMRQQCRSV
ncbi:hypothetical protein PpBr36_04879 [Pyricularia pennisetigena]|uniref:hypothetical protein n=1 Tax=Pyricularia pennisetigena TaxID=1578925 RepID=UPI00114EB9EC|nr:hypothetical protein PpBr36_04879 [Pyricularia pennisetigena]TLS26140.1 hypothetical protein PpBr36_04879 [Pyricularia pennisetigena]